MDIQEDAVEVECRLCNNMVYNLPEHPKKSSDKHVKCYKCRDEFPKQFITAHAKNAQLERKKNRKNEDDNDDDEDGGKKCKGSGRIFTCCIWKRHLPMEGQNMISRDIVLHFTMPKRSNISATCSRSH